MADLKEKRKTKVKSTACVVGLLYRDPPPVRTGREEGDDPDPPVCWSSPATACGSTRRQWRWCVSTTRKLEKPTELPTKIFRR